MNNGLVLSFGAPDRPGIMASISSCVAALGCDIRDAQVHGDAASRLFFVRLVLSSPVARDEVAAAISPVARALQLEWRLQPQARKMKVLVAVSRSGHCLIDLIHKTEIGMLPIEIVGVVSNHDALRRQTEWHNLPFSRLPLDVGKAAQEKAFRAAIDSSGAELVVLARYMQILSMELAADLSGRCINIHHSFLPSFVGAQPYHQAHARGVKIIGATAHYVTADLDEGPIIEQDVRRVTHADSPAEMAVAGREIEASVLSRAVQWRAEHRIFLAGNRTVVLR